MRIDEETYKAMPAHLQALFRAEPNPARDEVLAAFPQANGQQGAVTGNEPSSKTNAVYGQFNGRPATTPRGDTGSAARFFYCAKASKRERDEGLGHMPTVTADPYGQHRGRRMVGNDTRIDGKPPAQGKNNHPTVKPTDLMRYLCRLVTPPGGVVLDPFMGSGSTGRGAVLEGFRFVGIEREEEYVAIARARIEHVERTLAQPEPPATMDLFSWEAA
jgi:site-specific DNA-methyltransferase (adenine-specific)